MPAASAVEAMLWSERPTANRRCMTVSWRSRARRSRSAKTTAVWAWVVQASVLDGDARRDGERLDERFIVAGELRPALLVGEVEVAVDLATRL